MLKPSHLIHIFNIFKYVWLFLFSVILRIESEWPMAREIKAESNFYSVKNMKSIDKFSINKLLMFIQLMMQLWLNI